MSQIKLSLLIFNVFFVTCYSAFVDHLAKCGINDGACQRKLMQYIIKEIGKTGVPELGIPPIDPYVVNNVSVNLLDAIEIGLVDGVAKGFKDCVIDRFDTNIETEKSVMEMTCDKFSIKGQYRVKANSPIIKNLLGGSDVHGDGYAKVTLKKLHMRFDYDFHVLENKGETFLSCKHKYLRYTYDMDRITFAANNLYLGDQEASGTIIPILNDNWKFIMQTFGKYFMDIAADIIYAISHKFYDNVPTKYYIIDDLKPYVTNSSSS